MDLLTCFKVEYCNPYATPFQYGVKMSKTYQSPKVNATLYQQLIGIIIYLTHSRPDISFVNNVVSVFMHDPKES